MDLRDLHGMARRALPVDHGEGGRAIDRVRDVVDMVGRVEVLAVPAAFHLPFLSASFTAETYLIFSQRME
jgi:hypothetical protein